MEPDEIMDALTGELEATFKAMKNAKTVEEKLQYSEIVKNLCKSLGIFLDLASDMMPYDFEE